MKGYQNNDTLHGGSGDDRIFGDGYKYYDPAPNDRAIGGPGADRCEAERKRSCER
jgi:Ca2+-binding RTX toxin-like protein